MKELIELYFENFAFALLALLLLIYSELYDNELDPLIIVSLVTSLLSTTYIVYKSYNLKYR